MLNGRYGIKMTDPRAAWRGGSRRFPAPRGDHSSLAARNRARNWDRMPGFMPKWWNLVDTLS